MSVNSSPAEVSLRKKPDYDWIGSSDDDFRVTASDLEDSTELRKEWREEIDPEINSGDGWTEVEIRPTIKDAKNNSKASGDGNILHWSEEVVEELSEDERYPFVREPVQEEGVVVSQGMSFADALVPEFDSPLRALEGDWLEMVYAGKKNSDEVILSNRDREGFEATLLQGGEDDETLNAGKIIPKYVESPEAYHEDHNEYMVSLVDQAVGRSFSTPEDVRNGELLIDNRIETYGPVDWEKAQEFVFGMTKTEEKGPQMEIEWDIHVDYGEEIDERAMSYRETSMYIEGFEELDEVGEEYGESLNIFDAYMRAATEASLASLKANTAALKLMNRRL